MDRRTTQPRRIGGTDDRLRAARRLLGQRSSGRHLDLVHQPRRRGPGQGRGELQHRRLQDRGAGPAAERQRAAHPALAATRGGGPRDRHHEHRPALHRGVRERRLPGRDPRRPAGQAEAAVVQGRGGRRHLGRQAGRRAVLVQHPGALVPQVLRPEGRARHEAAGHLGPDHRRRREERRQGRRAGEQVRGLLGVDQRADLRRRRRDRHQHRQGRRPHPRGRLARG